MHGKCASLAQLALHLDVSAMQRDHALHDRKAKPCAARSARARLIHPVKPFKQVRLRFFRDPDAGVGNGKQRFRSVNGYTHRNASRIGVLDRIFDEVCGHLFKAHRLS